MKKIGLSLILFVVPTIMSMDTTPVVIAAGQSSLRNSNNEKIITYSGLKRSKKSGMDSVITLKVSQEKLPAIIKSDKQSPTVNRIITLEKFQASGNDRFSKEENINQKNNTEKS